MTVLETTAKTLHMKPEVLIKESLKFFVEQKIRAIEAEIFMIAKKYGVKDVFDLDKKVQEGLVTEKDSFDDYFHLDFLEAERQKLKQVAENFKKYN